MAPPERTETYAAVDLGSNSFHLLVARRKHGELRVLDRIREMVRIGGGLDKDGNLDEATSNRALDCLARFGQRLRGIPASNMRAVGTQTFRRLRKANSFLMVTETALGCPVDIIGGREEARLIYLGVSQGVSGHEDRRLVIDIGGGSTELVIGEGLEPMEMESLQFGCVSFTQWYFGNGELSRKRWEQARRGALAEMQELQIRYRDTGWKTAIGSSGTIRAVASICHARGWCERNITRPGLELLQKELLGFGTIDAIALPGLSERRKSVIVGGLAILSACFEALDLEELVVSPYALREGVLHDLLGRLEHRDPRDKTVQAFKLRYGVDPAQVERVRHTALRAFDQVAGALDLTQTHRDMLGWAADLHETGLSV
jgi:exopolyphosphatase/guanosine-5'-triphosphate,3'-diphosphate pyrophosphatase